MAGNFFIKFTNPEIKGESGDEKHKDQIQVLSWSHSFNQPTAPTRSSAGGGTVEQANHSDFSFTKYIDGATDDLLKMCWSGKVIGGAVFTAYRAAGDAAPVEYLSIEFTHVIISNYSISGGAGDLPTETVTMSYGKVKYVYTQQKVADGTADGKQPVEHDLVLQKVA